MYNEQQRRFVLIYYPFAKKVQERVGISCVFLLAQCALETGWGSTIVGNMMFGVKDTDGINGNEQLITTTEYHSTDTVKYPTILWIKKIKDKLFKYRIKDWFRKYNTPEDSFFDHSQFFFKNKRYKTALTVKDDYVAFAREVAKAGYATDPTYADKLISIGKVIQQIIIDHKLN